MNYSEAEDSWKSNDEWQYADKEAASKFFFAAAKESSQTVISAQCVKMSQYESIIFELRRQLASAEEHNNRMQEAGKFDMWKTNPYTKILETSIEQLIKQRDLAVEALEKALRALIHASAHVDNEDFVKVMMARDTINETLSAIKKKRSEMSKNDIAS